MELPKQIIKASTVSPQRLLLYSPPKCGKTTAVSMLGDSLLLDLENGSNFVDAVKIKIASLEKLSEVLEAVLKEGKPYRYGIVDTTTKLEEMVLPRAAELFRATPMGINWGRLPNGNPDPNANILALPNGGGRIQMAATC